MYAEALFPAFQETPNEIVIQIITETNKLTRRMLALTSCENMRLVLMILRDLAPKKYTRFGDPKKYTIAKFKDLRRKYVSARVDTILSEEIPAYFRGDSGKPYVVATDCEYVEACLRYGLPVCTFVKASERALCLASRHGNAGFLCGRVRSPRIRDALLGGRFSNYAVDYVYLVDSDIKHMVKYPSLVEHVILATGNITRYIFDRIECASRKMNDYRTVNILLAKNPNKYRHN